MNLATRVGIRADTGKATGTIVLDDAEFCCDAAGCLFWPAENTLIVSDLHLEKGSSYAVRGQMLPPYDTRQSLALLAARLDHWNPARVISLGDSFHDPRGSSRLDPVDRAELCALMSRRDWIWLVGNHDPEGPADLPGARASELAIGSIGFRHEPLAGQTRPEIAGHLHPQARIVRRGKAVRRRCFASDGNRLIMPAFGAYTGGLNLRDRAFAGLFGNALCAHVIGRDRIYRIAGRQLV